MLSPLWKRFLRVGVNSFLLALFLFVVSYSVWENYIAAVGYETTAAFMAILCIASLLLHQRGERSSGPILLTGGLLYYTIIELGGAIEKLILTTSPLLQKTNIVLASDLLEMVGLGAVFILSLIMHQRDWALNNRNLNDFSFVIKLVFIHFFFLQIMDS